MNMTMGPAPSTARGTAESTLVRRAFLWFTDTSQPEMPEVRRAMLLTLGESPHVTLLGFFWTQAVGAFGWGVVRDPRMLAWMATDAVFFAMRLAWSRGIVVAGTRARRLPVKRLFVLHAAWMASIAGGTALTASQPDFRLVVLGTILPVGFCGYVVSRWQAFPRCALTFIYLLCLGLFAGLAASPIPGLWQVAWLMPAGCLAYQVLLRLNHSILIGALRAQQENKRLSMHDPLTGLPNRLMLGERIAELCAGLRTARKADRFAVLCIDLDGFKAVNDRHGHAAGDWLLKHVADRLAQAVRVHDLVSRIGGDEFVVLLPGAGRTDAVEIANRLLHSVAQPHDLGGIATVVGRASVGIALAPSAGQTPEQLLEAADHALYAAKRAGKGVWRLHPSSGLSLVR